MSNQEFVSVLAERLSNFVEFRRLGGFDGDSQIRLFGYFDRFLHQEGFEGSWPTRDVVQRYIVSMEHLHWGSRRNRLSVVRQFCQYLQPFEPQCYVPGRNLVKKRRPSRIPHLYTENEIKALLKAAQDLPPAGSLRPFIHHTLFGLLYTTGLRCGEAFGLNLADLDLVQGLLTIREGKFGKSRLVTISTSTCTVLKKYVKERNQASPAAPELPLFVNLRGHRVHHANVDGTFRQLLKQCGLRGGKGCPGPRLHDLRHAFACRRILEWYKQGKDVNVLLPALATYMGHVKVTSTQVYLRATAELLEQANERFLKNFRQNVLRKGKSL